MLTFYDFPAEHWIHLRTTNPIESTFATANGEDTRLRLPPTILSMVFKLARSAEQRWQLLLGAELIARVIAGVQFKNDVITETENYQRVAA